MATSLKRDDVVRYSLFPGTGEYTVKTVNVSEREEASQDGSVWHNRAEEIIKATVGPEEFQKRLAKQNKLFMDGCKKGNIIDDISIYFKNGSLKGQMASRTKTTGKRALYSEGVGALGFVVMDPDSAVPPNNFFCKGRVYEVRARHSNFPHDADDSRVGIRSLSLKFADHDFDSPFDLILATGCISPYFNSESIEGFYKAKQQGNEAMKRHMLSLPVYLASALEGMRKNPDSYYHQHYHSQMTYDFLCHDGVRRLARFRVIPADNSPESGRLSYEEQKDAWYNFLLPREEVEDEGLTYLKNEFGRRVTIAPIHYQLQVQLHTWAEGTDNNMWYNPSLPWNSAEHKWLNLATINLNTLLSDDVVENTRFNVGYLPRDTVSFPEATSTSDFNFVPCLREYIYREVSKLREAQPAKMKEKQRSTEYLIHLKTGPQSTAGNTDQKCNVYVCLVGTEGRTSFIKLERKYKADFDKGQKSTFSIIDKPIGDFLCLKIFKDKKGTKSNWFLEYMILTIPYTNKCYTLPCYRWFNDTTTLFTLRDGRAVLAKEEEDEYIKLQRRLEVTERQRLIQWRPRDADEHLQGFPGYIAAGSEYADLPMDIRVDEMKQLELDWKKHAAGKNSFLSRIKSIFDFRKGPWTVEYEATIADKIAKQYKEKLKILEYVVRHWREDEEFGRQMLNGVNPLKVALLEDIPANLPLSESDVQGLLEPGATLQSELKRRRLYLITYPELAPFCNYERDAHAPGINNSSVSSENVSVAQSSQDVSQEQLGSGTVPTTNTSSSKKSKPPKIKPEDQPRYLCAPIVLLYQRTDNAVVPLAIQLTQEPSTPPLIYTRRDDTGQYSDWMLAKMWVRVADTTVQQLGVHMLGTHLLMEPVSIALLRNFPLVHPVFKLLFPHLRRVVSLNTIYRKYLLADEDGVFAEISPLGSQNKVEFLDFIQKEITDFKFDLFDLPENFAERGVIDHKAFPGYYYRDDSLNLWEAVMDYVTEMLAIYYQDDKDVEDDTELARFLQNLRTHGYPSGAGLPSEFTMVEELIKFCTTVIFRCSVHHTAISRGMPDIYSYAPNAPPAMMEPPPTRKVKEGYTELQMKAKLPHYQMIERYIGAVLLMQGGYEQPEVKLGEFAERMFTEDKAQEAVRRFQKRLREISQEITQRNGTLPVPYDYLLPENISNFIES